jgi:hypothetical protein
MERDKAARIPGEIGDGLVAEADHRNLKLHFNQLRIQLLHQFVVDQHAVDFLELVVVIVETKLKASLVCLFAELVQFLGGPRPVCHGGGRRQAKRRDDHLSQTKLVGIGDGVVQTLFEFPKLEMAALATQSRVMDHAADF